MARGDSPLIQASKEISAEAITEAALNAQIQDLIAEGYTEGRNVAFSENAERSGKIVGFNKKRSGFYSAERYPLLVKWDGEIETFEYSKDFLILK